MALRVSPTGRAWEDRQPGIGLVAALPREARAALNGIARSGAGTGLFEVRVAGIGPARARAATEELLAAGVRALISAGVAGGLDRDLRPGTVIIPDTVCSAAGEWPTAAPLNADLRNALRDRFALAQGRLYSSRRVVGSVLEKRALADRLDCVAVDMESAAVCAAGRAAGRPVVVIRVIADGAAETIPATVIALLETGGRAPAATLLARAWARPADLLRALRLRHRYRHACAVLERALAACAPALDRSLDQAP